MACSPQGRAGLGVKTGSIQPAEVRFDDSGHGEAPFAPTYGDVYHPRAGAFVQAKQVFLAGNGLPKRWRGRDRFVILETGFGLGNNFLATWAAWAADPERASHLDFISVERHPLRPEDLARAHRDSPAPEQAAELLAAWPPAVHGLHTLCFAGGLVRLHLAFGDLSCWLPELVARVDAFYLDGFAPARNAEMWDPWVLRSLGRLAASDATASTWSAARAVRDALGAAGFAVDRAPGFAQKREITTAHLPLAPGARRLGVPPGRRPRPDARQALVIGGGLAGASAARALAQAGLEVTVVDQAAEPAAGASGNLAGLFHGVVHPQDGAHAQLLRAAALRAAQVYRPLVESGRVPGSLAGLLRGSHDAGAGTLATLAARLGVPPDYAEPVGPERASELAGCQVLSTAWFFPQGGWLQPSALVRAWLHEPGVTWKAGGGVTALRQTDDGRWQAWGASTSAPLAQADVVVLANAHGMAELLAPFTETQGWPWRTTRGQVTRVPHAMAAALPHPVRPLARGGYLIGLPATLGGGLLCGATSNLHDTDGQLREADHRSNLAHVNALTGHAEPPDGLWWKGLEGRVGWRLSTDDRLPVLGPVPVCQAAMKGCRRLEQAQHVPRIEGLYVFGALGSRGLTWAPLLGEALAAWITGAPMPLAASLIDAVDPARFISRGVRRTSGA